MPVYPYKVTCSRCGSEIDHVCHAFGDLHEAIKRLFRWRPEAGFPEGIPDQGDTRVHERDTPFLTEAFLYPLLGKSDARSLMGLIEEVCRRAGHNPDAIQTEVFEEMERERQEELERQQRVAQRRAERARKGK